MKQKQPFLDLPLNAGKSDYEKAIRKHLKAGEFFYSNSDITIEVKRKELPVFDLPYEVAEAAVSNNLSEIMVDIERIERSLPLSLSDKVWLSASGISFGFAYYFFAELLAKLI